MSQIFSNRSILEFSQVQEKRSGNIPICPHKQFSHSKHINVPWLWGQLFLSFLQLWTEKVLENQSILPPYCTFDEQL